MNVWKFIRKQLHWLKGSGDNDPGGASSKKLTGFYCFVLVGIIVSVWCIWSYIHKDWSMLPIVLPTLVGAGLGALGINSNEKIKLQKQDEQP